MGSTSIAVDLIHPQRQTSVQTWMFDANTTKISIGRSQGNDVVLLSGVVSREHAVLRYEDGFWRIDSLSVNGCYLAGQLVRKSVPVVDGAIVRLAKTGPRLRFRFVEVPAPAARPRSSQTSASKSSVPRRKGISSEELTTARETWVPTSPQQRPTIAPVRPTVQPVDSPRKQLNPDEVTTASEIWTARSKQQHQQFSRSSQNTTILQPAPERSGSKAKAAAAVRQPSRRATSYKLAMPRA